MSSASHPRVRLHRALVQLADGRVVVPGVADEAEQVGHRSRRRRRSCSRWGGRNGGGPTARRSPRVSGRAHLRGGDGGEGCERGGVSGTTGEGRRGGGRGRFRFWRSARRGRGAQRAHRWYRARSEDISAVVPATFASRERSGPSSFAPRDALWRTRWAHVSSSAGLSSEARSTGALTDDDRSNERCDRESHRRARCSSTSRSATFRAFSPKAVRRRALASRAIPGRSRRETPRARDARERRSIARRRDASIGTRWRTRRRAYPPERGVRGRPRPPGLRPHPSVDIRLDIGVTA